LTGASLANDIIDGWLAVMGEFAAILDGKKLMPHWRFDRGMNVKRMFEESKRFDLVLLISGTDAVDYLEDGPVSDSATWNQLMAIFQGNFLGYALWFNLEYVRIELISNLDRFIPASGTSSEGCRPESKFLGLVLRRHAGVAAASAGSRYRVRCGRRQSPGTSAAAGDWPFRVIVPHFSPAFSAVSRRRQRTFNGGAAKAIMMEAMLVTHQRPFHPQHETSKYE
jgi:hypothetical protein